MSWTRNYNYSVVRSVSHGNLKQEKRDSCVEVLSERRRLWAKQVYRRRILKSYFMRKFLFEHQLYRGSEKYPRSEVMTQQLAHNRNCELEDSFMKKVELDSNTRLWKWCISDRKLFQDSFKMFWMRFIDAKDLRGDDFNNAVKEWAEKNKLETT